MTATADIGVIGGSGFYALDAIEAPERVELDTPFGRPSGPYVVGTLRGQRVAFLARHGEGHTILPHELPARANIHGFRQLGVDRLFAASAGGALQQHIEPGHAVMPDQLIDRTRGRPPSFFGDGLVAHVGLCYASICFVTDYDVWHEHEEDVSADLVLRVLRENTDRARAILASAIEGLGDDPACECRGALAAALMSAPHQVPAETRQRLALLVDRYWGPADSESSEENAS